MKNIELARRNYCFLYISDHAKGFLKQISIKILGCLKMLKMLHTNLLDFD